MTDNESERLLAALDDGLRNFEDAIETRFKPALRKAIADVMTEFMDGVTDAEIVAFPEPQE